jgi:HD-GYP domain-containing protein (c-di-GMP phosphodiesterase class II)
VSAPQTPVGGAAAREEVLLLVKALLTAVKGRGFYPLRHPSVAASVEELRGVLARLLARAPEVVLAVVGRELLVDGEPLLVDSPVLDRFREDLAARDAEKVSFRRGLRLEDLETLVESFCATPDALAAAGGIDRFLAARGVRAVQVGRLKGPEEDEGGDAEARARASYRTGIEGVEQLTEKFRSGRAVSAGEVREIASLMIQGLRGQRSPMLAALALRQKSAYTFTHSLNVSLLVLAQVEMLDLPERQLEEITAAGLLHDVGKLFVPDEILDKTGPLDPQEWQAIRRHPVHAVEVLRRMKGVSDLVLIAAFEHHLGFNGQGYPVRRAPWPQNHVTYLTALADCYDAMRSFRSYDPERPCEQVYATMTGLAEKAFHPRLLDRFFRIVGKFSPGTVVRLSDGAVGKVTKNHPAWHDRPLVQLTWTPAEGTLETPRVFDLALERELHAEGGTVIVESVRDQVAPGAA